MNRLKVISTIAIRILVVAVSLACVQPAVAGFFSLSDGFEVNPASSWRIESYPHIPSSTRGEYYSNYGMFATFASYARTGSNYVYLTAGYKNTWWSGVGKQVTLPAHATVCQLRFYVMPWYKTRNKIRVEVIDPATWTYISYKDITLDYTDGGYKLVQTNQWSATMTSVYVRIALTGGYFMPGYDYYTPTIGVDDMSVYCPI